VTDITDAMRLFFRFRVILKETGYKGSCVVVGRCADYVLKDHPRAINLFITANLEERVKRVMIQQHLSLAEARSHIEKTDKRRATYYNFYSNKVWGVADSYDLCVNTSVLGIDETVKFLKIFIEKKFFPDR
jgi:cytidylate kinase